MADNTGGMLIDPRFQASGIHRVRYIASYDAIAKRGRVLKAQDAWFKEAKAQHIEPLISFYRTSACSPKCAAKRLPTVKQYTASVKQYMKRYPWVKAYSTWDEENFPAAEPTGRNPARTAQFYLALRKLCKGKCTALTGDFRINGSKFSDSWLKTFKKGIGKGSHTWGLVPHVDINAQTTKYTKAFLKATSGPVWATEAGANYAFRPTLKPSLTRQTKSMKFLMGPFMRVSSRLKRIYVYHWKAVSGQTKWDSGLLDTKGKPRPAYNIFFKGLGKTPPQ